MNKYVYIVPTAVLFLLIYSLIYSAVLKSETCINSVLFKITPILSSRMHRVCRFKCGICDL